MGRWLRALVLVLAASLGAASSAHATTWTVLVAAFRYTQVNCLARGDSAQLTFSHTLSQAEIATMRTATENYARLVASWSNGARAVAVDFVVIDDPITCVSRESELTDPPSYWVLPEDVLSSSLPQLAASGKYDSVFVLWHSGENGEIPTPNYAGVSVDSPISLAGRTVTYSTVPWVTFHHPDNAKYLYSPEVMVHEWLHPVPFYYRVPGGYAVPDADESTSYGYPADANGSFAKFYTDVLRGRVVNTGTAPQSYTGISDSVWASSSTQHPAPAGPAPVQLLVPLDYDCASTTPILYWRAVPGSGISYVVSIYYATNLAAALITIPTPNTAVLVPGAANLQPFGVYAWNVQAFLGATGSASGDLLHFVASGTAAAPVVSPNGGQLPTTGLRVKLSSGKVAAPIRYTLDGTDPGPTSTLAGLGGETQNPVIPPATLKARVFGVSSCGASPIATANFTLPNPIMVTKTDDTGTGSLRAAMTAAEANPGADTIMFNMTGPGVFTFVPLSPLPVRRSRWTSTAGRILPATPVHPSSS